MSSGKKAASKFLMNNETINFDMFGVLMEN